MRETRTKEFKEKITNTFLKTVSAFSNYDGGEIFFGVDDNGNIKGLSDVKQACLDIENKINDSIIPQPDYTLELQNNDRTMHTATFCGQQGRIFRTVRAILNGQPGISAGQRVVRPTDQYCSLFQQKAMLSQSVQ